MPLPPKLLRAWHHRHRAHLRCAHERHRLRHRGAARLAGSRGRRTAGAGARAAISSKWTCPAGDCISMSAMRSWHAAAPAWQPAPRRNAAGTSCTSITCSRRISAPISTFWSAAAAWKFRATRTSQASSSRNAECASAARSSVSFGGLLSTCVDARAARRLRRPAAGPSRSACMHDRVRHARLDRRGHLASIDVRHAQIGDHHRERLCPPRATRRRH